MAIAVAAIPLAIKTSPCLSLRREPHFYKFQPTLLRRHGRRATVPPKRSPPLSCAPAPAPESIQDNSASTSEAEKGKGMEEEESFTLLASIRSPYNEIMVVDTKTSRFLLLDSSHNIHSMLNKDKIWTGSYWDEFACLPAIIPQGPIAIFGLGAGTAAHLMLELWPSLHLIGWEIDEILIDMARDYFGLSNLEKCTKSGGSLSVRIGDALSPSNTIEGGFAGIIVDLFSDGRVIPELHEVTTWTEMTKKLMPNGRIMINCGGVHAEASQGAERTAHSNVSPDSSWVQHSTIKALCSAFPGKVNWKRMDENESDNYLALTGPLPDLDAWSATVPNQLSSNVRQWRTCDPA
ncbi:uncharacterized protein [Typha angustifolia]|uniref:uncharacterized protein isoform X1 n=1 Tax=Typha angustifolia TaxID=59011 RepID=UPI003C2C11B7